MNSFSSASQMCEPFPRTINGGSPPTEPKARTGEFTPPGIMLSARFCRRRDCSTFRDKVDGIKCSAIKCSRGRWVSTDATAYYISAIAQINHIFTVLPSFRNIAQIASVHHVALLTGRVTRTASGLRAVLFAVLLKYGLNLV